MMTGPTFEIPAGHSLMVLEKKYIIFPFPDELSFATPAHLQSLRSCARA